MKHFRHENQYSQSNFTPLWIMLGIMATGFILKTAYDPQELHNPFISHSYGVSKVQASEPIVESPVIVNFTKMADGIHFLESGRGTAKIGLQGICEKQGKTNEYGYGGMKLKICFDNKIEAEERINIWLVKHYGEFNDVGMTMCYYNLGIKVKDCKYYQDYLSMGSK